MISQSNSFEKRAQKDLNKLKEKYVIDLVTGERLQEVLVYLYLSQASRNQRGIDLQTRKLNGILHNCSKIVNPVFAAPAERSFHAVG